MNELQLKMAEINKKYKAQIIQEGTDIIKIKKIPFSSPMANYMTYGGIPVAKITEFFGGEGGGKTTSALDICGNAQRLFMEEYANKVKELQEHIEALTASTTRESTKQVVKLEQELQQVTEKGAKCVLYVDTEQTLDVEWARTIGVDTESLILVRPQEQTAEQVLQMIIELIDTGGIGLCILDSIPCLVPQNIFEESLEKKSYGGISQPLTVFCSKILPYLTVNQCAFIGINQIREDLSSMYSTMSTPGGKAWKHACSLRLRFRKDSYLDDKNNEVSSRCENPAGNKVGIEIIKTKVCKPDRRLGYYTLNYMNGIDVVYDTINVAIFYNIISKAGSWYRILDNDGNIMRYNDTDLNFQGLSKCKEFLTENEDLLQDVISRLEDAMNG
jgi:recombination protein RecA